MPVSESTHLPDGMYGVFAIALIVYCLGLYLIGWIARRRIHNVEDFVLAGRRLPTSLAAITIIATWFGAESLMTTADEVGNEGLRKAMLDPLGIAVCLLLAGLFIAGPMWRMGILTVSDFFRQRYGVAAEKIASLIIVPSYFGWVAAQFVALAQILEVFFGIPKDVGIFAVATIGTGYTLMGGMWTITWTDAIQMGLILIGLLVLGAAILVHLGDGNMAAGMTTMQTDIAEHRWRIADPETFWRDTMVAISALAIGALGNLPMQDLMQRIFSAKTDKVAVKACLIAAGGYLLMGILPVGTGMAAHLLLPSESGELDGVVVLVAAKLLNPTLLLIFFLAIVSAVLSTIVSAVMAPAAVLAHNLVEPMIVRKRSHPMSQKGQLRLQRVAIGSVTALSAALAWSGQGAYELVQASYSMALVGLFIPFVFGIHSTRLPPQAAWFAMGWGVAVWTLHFVMGWEMFFEPWLEPYGWVLPHELAGVVVSAVGLIFGAYYAKLLPPRELIEETLSA
ncbi:sodium:solute symporter family protein [Aporhodopirellula aestuarii]|uniref:Sodium:solute symporter family protein n=1 Tax=Aporhodopirellula aestuarii TaxID=2950107 RepID=A0ABT0UE91_9BACT|nr:sodium:solute symporter family protein [Aporhodopirellula aestuarii]MCM2375213.1 sodium:solute symporter family protein [Aporhodopirellula aestuarii]